MIDHALQPGDRVILNKDNPDNNPELFIGDTGTVCKHWNGDPDFWVAVAWDKQLSGGHDCDGTCEKKHGWKVPVRFLETLPDREYDIDDEAVPDDYELLSFMCE